MKMNLRIATLLLLLAAFSRAFGGIPPLQSPSEPSVADIGRMIAEREKNNWGPVLDYFERFARKPSSVTRRNVVVWDAYLQLRVETWFERSQQWKTRESIYADAERAVQTAREYFEWYDRLNPEALAELRPSPPDSPYAKATAPGRIRFGVAIYGNAFLELGRPDAVLKEFPALRDDWFGEEAFNIWIAAAAYDHSRESRETSEVKRIQKNVDAGRVRPRDVAEFNNKLTRFLEAWNTNNRKENSEPLPPPQRWDALQKSLKKWLDESSTSDPPT